MLVDLFADCLPNKKKRMLHYSTFMLDVLSKIEQLRRSRLTIIPASLGQDQDYSLLWLARDMISKSPILFLDEFQLPDRAAAKIMTNLMTCFFHLGGVLIATSNRMPEELAKAAGMEFTPPPSGLGASGWTFGVGRYLSGRNAPDSAAGQTEYGKFFEVLKARCESWELESARDYRRQESDDGSAPPKKDPDQSPAVNSSGLEALSPGNLGLGYEQSTVTNSNELNVEDGENRDSIAIPQHFYVKPSLGDSTERGNEWHASFSQAQSEAFSSAISKANAPIRWEPSNIKVYGRTIPIPRQHDGVVLFTFPELCQTALGPADYITLASTFHTLILTDIPVLSLLQKNEARRLITLLDALYEARCKLLVSADAGPDGIFFPEATKNSTAKAYSASDDGNRNPNQNIEQDVTYPETFSEIYQDTTSPFRPNVSTYSNSDPSLSAPSEPGYTYPRLAGMLSSTSHQSPSGDQLEDTPPNSVPFGRGDSIYGLDASPEQRSSQLANAVRKGPDFSQTGVFTGEDEKFAFKRARSRLWEMCGGRWWARGVEDEMDATKGGEKLSWWRPLPLDSRPWESSYSSTSVATTSSSGLPQQSATTDGVKEANKISKITDEEKAEAAESRYRLYDRPPPSFSLMHFWGTTPWGRKAGRWGKGVEGLSEETSAKGDGQEDNSAVDEEQNVAQPNRK